MSTEEINLVISQPLPSSGNLAWVWLAARSSPVLPATIRLVRGDEIIQEMQSELFECMYLGRSFTEHCKPGMEIQVLAHGPAAAISRCEVRFGFASRKHNIGDIHELKHDGRRSNKRQLLMLKPSEQRLAFLTIAYRCQAGNLMEADRKSDV